MSLQIGKSKCCNASAIARKADEGTGHYECQDCGKACDVMFPKSPQFNTCDHCGKPIEKVGVLIPTTDKGKKLCKECADKRYPTDICIDCQKRPIGSYNFWCNECGLKNEKDYVENVLGWKPTPEQNPKCKMCAAEEEMGLPQFDTHSHSTPQKKMLDTLMNQNLDNIAHRTSPPFTQPVQEDWEIKFEKFIDYLNDKLQGRVVAHPVVMRKFIRSLLKSREQQALHKGLELGHKCAATDLKLGEEDTSKCLELIVASKEIRAEARSSLLTQIREKVEGELKGMKDKIADELYNWDAYPKSDKQADAVVKMIVSELTKFLQEL